MGDIRLRVLHVGPKNYPANHGGVEKIVSNIVDGIPEIENHIFTEWKPESEYPRVMALPKGLFAQLTMVRLYANNQSIDIIHLHKETFIPLALLLKLTGHRCILTIHGCAWRLKRWFLHTRLALFLLDCLACCLLDKTVFVGEYDWRLFKRIVPFRRLHLIRNGVTVREEKLLPNKSGMIYIGRLSPEKNILHLIEAAGAAAITIDLYGPFDHRNHKFQKAVLDLLRSSRYAAWKGPLHNEDVHPTLSKYRFFVNPSFSEGLPLSVLEAAAEGLYLFLSDIPQHRLLKMPACTYIDPYALDLTCALLIRDGQGHQNRDHVKREFDVRKMLDAYTEIYRSLM